MAIKIEGGAVSLQNDVKVKAIVDTINFPDANRVNNRVPVNSVGVMTLKSPPDNKNFKNGDTLNYRDSNNNNDASLAVKSVVGPSKYNIMKTSV
jgi:hypothetical protein